jgi:chorismate synthase
MNTFGRKFRVSIFGESHGELIGVVLDGVPAGLELSEQDFEHDIQRRKSGAKGTTPRQEEDKPQIVSGIFEGHTTGAPLTIVFKNLNTKSSDYDLFAAMPRPGHADLTAALKWDDCQDPRGSGHFSGRLTLPVVAAGVVAKKILQDATLLDDTPFSGVEAQIVEMGDLDEAMREGDSVGAVIECTVPDIDPGYGEPFWDSVESLIAHAIFAIPGVRGIEFGDGFMASKMRGSEHNDPIGPDGRPTKNGAGGANGGITNGAPVKFRVAFKPTSSISRPQQTFNFTTGEMDTLQVPGRHDVCFALRAPVVVEAMTAIVLADLVLIK